MFTQSTDREIPVRQAVEEFYEAFNDEFVGACDFSTEDWNHIKMQDQNTAINS